MCDGGERGDARVVFDWYAASFPGVDEDEFIGEFFAANDLASVAPYVGKTHGYERGYRLVRGDEVLASVLCGGNNGAPLNAWASGSRSRFFAKWSRDAFPGHYVTRGDAAMDFNDEGAWSCLQDLFFDLRDRFPRVQSSVVGDLFDGRKGATLYLGSVKSEARMRFYQKGLQMPDAGHPHHVRAEYSVKPKGLLRQAFAEAPAATLWSYTPLSRAAFERLQGFDPGQVVRETPRRTDLERRFDAMVRQYGKTVLELVQLLGSAESVGVALAAAAAGGGRRTMPEAAAGGASVLDT